MSDELSFYMQTYVRREARAEIELVPQGQDGTEDQQTLEPVPQGQDGTEDQQT